MIQPMRRPDLQAERPITSLRLKPRNHGRRRVARWGVIGICALIVLGVVILTGRSLVSHSGAPASPEEVPTIVADGPIKEKPQDPGGIDIPHQDVTVFDPMDKSKPEPSKGVEHLLPPPAVPQPVPAEPASLPAPDAPPVGAVSASESSLSPTETVMAPVGSPSESASTTPAHPVDTIPADTPKTDAVVAPPSALEPAPSVSPPSHAVAMEPPAPVAPKPVAKAATTTAPKASTHLPKELFLTGQVPVEADKGASSTGGWMIQLASVPDKASAEMAVKKLQAAHADALSGVALHVVRADLGAKGIFYRVQGGPLTEAKARAMCAKLAGSRNGCLPVRP